MYKTIQTKAELKRLPIGTTLTLTNCLMGACNDSRTIKAIKSNKIVMQLPDGRESNCYLDNCILKPTETGFELHGDESDRLLVAYKVHQ